MIEYVVKEVLRSGMVDAVSKRRSQVGGRLLREWRKVVAREAQSGNFRDLPSLALAYSCFL